MISYMNTSIIYEFRYVNTQNMNLYMNSYNNKHNMAIANQGVSNMAIRVFQIRTTT